MGDYDHKGDNENKIEGSQIDNSFQFQGNVGRDINLSQNNSQPLSVPLDNKYEDFFMSIGKWLVEKSTPTIVSFFTIPTLASGGILADYLEFKMVFTNLWWSVGAIVWLIFALQLLGYMMNRSCPLCNAKVSLYSEEKKLHATGKYQGETIHNVENIYRCSECGKVTSKKGVEYGK